MDNDDALDAMEYLADHLETLTEVDLILRETIRKELGICGMSKTYRDRFVALSAIRVEPELSSADFERLIKIVRKLVRKYHNMFTEVYGYTDESFSWMGTNFKVKLEA